MLRHGDASLQAAQNLQLVAIVRFPPRARPKRVNLKVGGAEVLHVRVRKGLILKWVGLKSHLLRSNKTNSKPTTSQEEMSAPSISDLPYPDPLADEGDWCALYSPASLRLTLEDITKECALPE